MITFKHFIQERISKNKWEHLLTSDKLEYADDLLSAVNTAYRHTSLGSFVKSISDIQSSDWEVLDYDNEPDIDDAIFFRYARPNELWTGRKIQGIGHDGTQLGKQKVIKRVIELLSSSEGWWIEASDALAKQMLNQGIRPITNKRLLLQVFPSISMFHPDGSYTRTAGNAEITEYAFGDLNTAG